MGTIGEFEKKLQGFADRVKERYAAAIRDVAREVHNRVIERTPVATGRARASWLMKVGEGPRLDVAPADARLGAEAAGDNARASQSTLRGFRDPFTQRIWISNNLPYIGQLEHGRSAQAPAGMVLLTLAEVAELGVAHHGGDAGEEG